VRPKRASGYAYVVDSPAAIVNRVSPAVPSNTSGTGSGSTHLLSFGVTPVGGVAVAASGDDRRGRRDPRRIRKEASDRCGGPGV
jgi:hypothetical protein